MGHTEVMDAAVAPTCTATGLTEGKHCSVCNEVFVAQETVAALGHTPGAEATCTNPQNCTVCGDEIASANGHIPGAKATCTTNQVCLVCTVELSPAFGHTEVTDAVAAPTCTTTGLTEGKHCSVCNEVLVAQETVAALGHTEAVDAAVAPTCTAMGLTEGKHCDVCNKVLVAQIVLPALGHTEGEIVVENNVDSTCTETGSYDNVVYCTVCGEELSRESIVVDALGHDMGKWYQNIAPACTTEGENRRDCSRCDYYVTEVIVALGHIEVIDAAVAPDCTNAGLTEGKHCSVCDEVLVTQEIAAALGHNYDVSVTEPNCTEQGYTTYTCHCGDTYIDDIVPATGSLGLAYTVNADGKTCTITGIGTCNDTELYINDTIDGYKVTAIGDKAFSECTHVTFIKIPESVSMIGTRAFYGCTGISEITIPASVTSIGTQIFYKATNLHTVYYNSAYSSPDNPFLNTSSITKVVFGGTNVPDLILNSCSYIKEIDINNSVKWIGSSAFENCTSLTSVTIGNNVRTIYRDTFYGCTSLTNVYITDLAAWCQINSYWNASWGNSSSNPLYYATNLYLNGELVTELVIPDGVSSIGKFVFYGCSSVTNITIPTSVTSIGECAFSYCSSLTNITIPDSITTIGKYAFWDCSSLTSITIPDSVMSIGESAFTGCSSLTSITIPDSVMSISDNTFSGCSSLTSIIIPDSVMSIGQYAFYGCSSLISITIPDGVTSIKQYTFADCCSLTSITIPDSVTSIAGYAFYRCRGLTSIAIPNGVTIINPATFCGCSSLTSITLPDGMTSINSTAFFGCDSLISITLPDGVTSIGTQAFDECISLTSIEIPNSVTRISSSAFARCSSLTDVFYTGTEEEWAKIWIDGNGNYYLTNATIHFNYER